MTQSEEVVQFSIKSFYGKHRESNRKRKIDWKARLEEAERNLKIRPVIKPYRSRLDAPCILWQTFYRQQEAFDFAHSSSEDLKVFAFESPTLAEPGKRMYLVASYDQFWHYYSQLTPDHRHHYEVIPEGAVCKLYFDLEFSKEVNLNSDGDNMVLIFIKFVIEKLRQVFNIVCHTDDILQLDSSSSTKFSQHLVFIIHNAAFRDNIHIGRFVQRITSELWKIIKSDCKSSVNEENKDFSHRSFNECKETDERSEPYSENNGDSPEVISHYFTQHVPKPSVGANNPLNAGHEVCTHKNHSVEKEELRCHETDDVEHRCVDATSVAKTSELTDFTCVECLKQLVVSDKDGRETLFCDTGVYTKNRNFRLYLSSKIGKKRPLVVAEGNEYKPKEYCDNSRHAEKALFMDSLISNVKYSSSLNILSFNEQEQTGSRENMNRYKMNKGVNGSPNIKDSAVMESYGRSPYPEIDDFILHNIITKGGVQGKIRRWLYFTDGEVILYDIVGNRWCHNIGRPHKSNNIMIVVSVKDGTYYQKCHDPECKLQNFKSPDFCLPRDILPQGMCQDDSGFDSLDISMDDMSDSDLMKAVDGVETSKSDQVHCTQRTNQINADYTAGNSTPNQSNLYHNGCLDACDVKQSNCNEVRLKPDQLQPFHDTTTSMPPGELADNCDVMNTLQCANPTNDEQLVNSDVCDDDLIQAALEMEHDLELLTECLSVVPSTLAEAKLPPVADQVSRSKSLGRKSPDSDAISWDVTDTELLQAAEQVAPSPS